jgi:hypothetical protein
MRTLPFCAIEAGAKLLEGLSTEPHALTHHEGLERLHGWTIC